MVQAQVDGGQRQGATSEELSEIKDLKAKVRRLEEDNEVPRRTSILFADETRAHPEQPGQLVSGPRPRPDDPAPPCSAGSPPGAS